MNALTVAYGIVAVLYAGLFGLILYALLVARGWLR